MCRRSRRSRSRPKRFDARADRAAPREPRVRELPRDDGSARPLARELRFRRKVAGRRRTLTPIDASGTLPDGTKFEGPAGLRDVLLASPTASSPRSRKKCSRTRWAGDSSTTTCRPFAGSRGRPRGTITARHRWSSALSTVFHFRCGGPSHDHHKMALPRRTFLRGLGATLALPLLDAMVPALSAMVKTRRDADVPSWLHLRPERRRDE